MKIEEIKASLDKFDANVKKIQANYVTDSGGVDPKNTQNYNNDMINECMSAIANLRDYVYRSNDQHYQNMQDHKINSTHLPKLSASQTEKLLKFCGADSDFTVVRPSIFARASKNRAAEFDVTLNNIKK